MSATAGRSGYGITQQDMEASRLVFVSVKDAKPRRKVAVPVPDGFSWEQFVQQVQTKLKLVGVQSIYLASSGELVTRLDDLQDIDELHVVEAKAPPPVLAASEALANGNGATLDPLQSGGRAESGYSASTSLPDANAAAGPTSPIFRTQSDRHRIASADTEITPAMTAAAHMDHDRKYVKRSSSMRRTLQRLFPSVFPPSLPVTTRDVGSTGGAAPTTGRRKRRQRSCFTARNLLLFFALVMCMGTMVFLYSRVSPRLP
ncbi:hypothetical protein WJX72_006776 [[Myrmecia] bisecta]|uniref:PB1 domain-containing protein n=1 Tax=[Myrmecia] bisecta TaxID=41462 RepID=A0AAW1QFL4_9CHLO